MAKRQNRPDTNPATDDEIEAKAFGVAPKGGTKRTAERVSAWIAKEEGAAFVCKLIGRFSRPDPDTGEPKYYYQVRILTDTVKASVKGEDDLVPLKAGEVANLDENKGIEPLRMAMEEGEMYAWIHFVEKRQQERDKRRTVWVIDVQSYKTCPEGVDDVEAPF
jgi:hypothetical protein